MKNLDIKKVSLPSFRNTFFTRASDAQTTQRSGLFLCPKDSCILQRYAESHPRSYVVMACVTILALEEVYCNGTGDSVFYWSPSSKSNTQMKAINHTSDKAAASVRPQSKSPKLKDLDKSLVQFFLQPIPNPRGLGSFVAKENVTISFTFNHYTNEIVPSTSVALPPEHWYVLAVYSRNQLINQLI